MRGSVQWFVFLFSLFCLPVAAEELSVSPGWKLSKISQQTAELDGNAESPAYFELTPPDGRIAVSVDARTADRLFSGEIAAEDVYGARIKKTDSKGAGNAAKGSNGIQMADDINSTLTLEEGRIDSPFASASGGGGSTITGASGGGGSGGMGSMAGASSSGGSLSSSPTGSLAMQSGAAAPSRAPSSLPADAVNPGTPNPLQSDEPAPGSPDREIQSANPSTTGTIISGPGIAVMAGNPPTPTTSTPVAVQVPPPPPPVTDQDIAIDAASCQNHSVTSAGPNAQCDDNWLAMGAQYTKRLPHLDSLHCCQLKLKDKPAKKGSCTVMPFSIGKFVSCPQDMFLSGLITTANATPTGLNCCSYSFDDQHALGWGAVADRHVVTYNTGKVYLCPAANQVIAAAGDNIVPDHSIDNVLCYQPTLRKP